MTSWTPKRKNIKFIDPTGATVDEIKTLEQTIKTTLYPELKSFLIQHSGAKLSFYMKSPFIKITHEDGYIVRNIVENIESIPSIIKQWKFISYLSEMQEHFELKDQYVESNKLMPIMTMFNSGELYIAISGKHQGKIYHCDNGDFGIIKIAHSIDELFEMFYLEE